MKKKLIILFILLVPFLFTEKVLANSLYNQKEIEYPNISIDNIIKGNESYLILDSKTTTIYKYDLENNLIATKTIEELSNTTLHNTNNKYYLIGKQTGFITIYQLNDNLKVENILETNIPISINQKTKIYNYNSKTYFLITENNSLVNNYICELDEELNLKENKLSNTSILKEILYSDYEVYFNNSITENIIASSKNINMSSMIGYKNNYFLRIIDNDNNHKNINLKNKPLDILILNNKIYVLTNNKTIELLTYDNLGNLEETTKLNYSSNNAYLSKINNELKIVIPNINKIISFNYNSSIIVDENIYGTIKVPSSANYGEKVKFSYSVNSGYSLKEINIYDEYNNKIEVKDDSFIMPEGNVIIETIYQEEIVNPDTIDIILIIAVVLIISLFILYKTYRRLKWLN